MYSCSRGPGPGTKHNKREPPSFNCSYMGSDYSPSSNAKIPGVDR